MTHVLILPRVVLFLYDCVDIDVALSVGTKEDIYDLLPSPELDWLENARWRDFNAFVCISEVSAHSHELGSVQEHIFLGNEIARCQEILCRSNQGVS